jgi:hypothetical protein
MLRSEAIAIIKRGLGFRQTQDSAIVAALKQAQISLEEGKTLPSWLVVYDEVVPVTAGTAVVALPTGFLRLHEEYPLYFVDADGKNVAVPKRNAMEAESAYGDSDSDYAQVYVQRGRTAIELVPGFLADTTLYLTYYKAADVLDSDIENAWLANASNYLVGLAGVLVAGDLRDAGASQKFTTMAKMGAQSYLGAVVDEELSGRALIMGRNN